MSTWHDASELPGRSHTFLPEAAAPLQLLLDEALHVQVHIEGGLH